jgi:hypothetical protein
MYQLGKSRLTARSRIKFFIVVMTFICSLWSHAAFSRVTTRDQIQSLPDNGPHSCTLFQHQPRQPNWGIACHLTMIGPSQAVLPDNSCFQDLRAQGEASFQIFCGGQRVIAELNQIPPSNQYGDLLLLDLPIQLEIEAAQLVQTQAQRESLLERGRCHLISPLTTNAELGGARAFDIEIHTDQDDEWRISHPGNRNLRPDTHGSQLQCLDDQERPVIMGLTIFPNQIQWFDEYSQLHESRVTDPPVVIDLSSDALLQLNCRESGLCLENLSTQVVTLAQDTQDLLGQLFFDYGRLIETSTPSDALTQDQAQLDQELGQMNREFREILIACQQISLAEIHRHDSVLEGGVGANILGFAQNLGLSAGQLFSSDTLYNQFKNVEILQSNLSEEEMRTIIQQVTERYPDRSSLQLAVAAAGEMTKQVVRRYIREMELATSTEEEDAILSSVTSDFDLCLEQAVNSGQIMTCADRVALRVPAELGRMELTQQLETNYLDLFSVDGQVNSQAFEQMRESAIAGYQRCLLQYYYPEQIQTDHVEKAKTCVYEAMLIGYRESSRFQIRETFAPLLSDPDELAREINLVRESSQQCQSGALFHRAGNYQAHDYHALSQIVIDDFEERLRLCSQELIHNAGDRAVRLTLMQDASLQRNLEAGARTQFVERVIDEYYNGCMQIQNTNLERAAHPIHCENYIRQMVTLDIARTIMGNTIEEQLQELQNISSEESARQQRELTDEVVAAVNSCQEQLRIDHQETLRVGQDGPGQAELIDCLNQGIGLIAESVVELRLEETLRSTPDMAEYTQEILSLEQIQRLPSQTRTCFESAINEIEDISLIDSALEEIVQRCSLEATRAATMISAEIVLERRLADIISDPDERAVFIEEYINGENGLRLRVDSTESLEELEGITNRISADVTLRYASRFIPQLVANYLNEIVTQSEIDDIQADIVGNLEECLQRNEVDLCVNTATRNGYQMISSEVIEHSIQSAISDDPALARELSLASSARVSECLEEIELNQAQRPFDIEVTQCVAHEVLEVSRRIPSSVLLSVAPLMGSNLRTSTLQSRLEEADQIARSRGSFPPRYSADPATLHYANLHQCLASVNGDFLEDRSQEDLAYRDLSANLNCRSNLNLRSGPSTEYLILRGIPCRSSSGSTPVRVLSAPNAGWIQIEYEGVAGHVSVDFLTLPQPRALAQSEPSQEPELIDLEQLLQASDRCTSQFEQNVRNEIRSNFIRGSYAGRTRNHDRALGIAGDILLMMQGSSEEEYSGSSSQDTLTLMQEVGQQVVNSCRYHQQRCEASLRETRTAIEQYLAREPNATSAQLQTRFLASPFMDLAMEATVAQTFTTELSVALREFQDPQGILQNRMNYITSPAMIQRVFSGRYGRAAREYIRQRLEDGNIDSLANDQRLRAILASAVTEDLSDGGFVDELLYGIVQPRLNEERGSFQVGLGSIFGVVSRNDFDWHRVRQTAHGQEARRLFAREILEPMFQGVELGRMPSSHNQGKSVLDDNIGRVEQLIEDGIRGLSR